MIQTCYANTGKEAREMMPGMAVVFEVSPGVWIGFESGHEMEIARDYFIDTSTEACCPRCGNAQPQTPTILIGEFEMECCFCHHDFIVKPTTCFRSTAKPIAEEEMTLDEYNNFNT